MAEIESSNFFLSCYMTTNSDTVGGIFEFNGFNIREALGDMYDKYDKFKISLNTVLTWNNVVFSNRAISVKMSGLDWVGYNEYGTDDKTLATVGLIWVGSNSGVNTQTNGSFGVVFNKPKQDSVNLRIRFFDLILNDYNSTQIYKVNHFYFNIYGVK